MPHESEPNMDGLDYHLVGVRFATDEAFRDRCESAFEAADVERYEDSVVATVCDSDDEVLHLTPVPVASLLRGAIVTALYQDDLLRRQIYLRLPQAKQDAQLLSKTATSMVLKGASMAALEPMLRLAQFVDQCL